MEQARHKAKINRHLMSALPMLVFLGGYLFVLSASVMMWPTTFRYYIVTVS